MVLRPATIKDAELLLGWRNDPFTRAMSRNTHEISLDEHISWLTKALANDSRKLYVAEINGVPVGTVRADLSEGGTELSWAVSPDHRGKGIGKKMVCLLASRLEGRLYAHVRPENIASRKIAEAAGLHLLHP